MNNTVKKAKVLGNLSVSTSGIKLKEGFFDKYNLKADSFSDLSLDMKTRVSYNGLQETLKNEKRWVTYSGNADISLEMGSNGFDAKITVWDGSTVDGSRTRTRFTAQFKNLSYKKIYFFTDDINRAFDMYAGHLYQKEQEIKAENRIEAIKNELLTLN